MSRFTESEDSQRFACQVRFITQFSRSIEDQNWKKRRKEESSSMDLEHINYYPKRLQGWLKVFHLWQYWLWQHVKIDKSCWTQSSSHPPKAKSWACATGQRIWNSRLPLQHQMSNVPCFGLFRPFPFHCRKRPAFASRIVASPGSCNSATCTWCVPVVTTSTGSLANKLMKMDQAWPSDSVWLKTRKQQRNGKGGC